MIDTVGGGGGGVLALGFLIGMQHALEADHIAAVSSIASGERETARIVRHGAAWGLGHTITLGLVGGGAVLLGAALSPNIEKWIEVVVGVMLIALGLDVLRRLRRERVHFHAHSHGDGRTHWHAHGHRGETGPHDPRAHAHLHPPRHALPLRSLAVGMMHGLAGSAALLILTATAVASVPLALGYILLFGLGSILGMALLSVALAVPLGWSARALTGVNGLLRVAIGLATVAIGVKLAFENASVLAGL